MGLNTWTELVNDTIPPFESLPNTSGVPKLKKVYLKDGAATTTDGSVIYATKGGGYNFMWKYTPGIGWTSVDSVPRLHKKSVIKTGGAMTYANGAIWLLKGNKSPEFWKYIPFTKSTVKTQSSKITQIVGQGFSLANLKVCPTISVVPNPLTKITTIQYTIPVSGKVLIRLYNVTGNLIETVINEYMNAGTYTTNLSTDNLAKGIYFLRCENTNNRTETKLVVQ